MIEIQDLEDLTIIEITELLRNESKPFEIYVPKETQMHFSEPDAIAMDYAQLAYCGHLLKEVSSSFSYEEVPPSNHESVCFTVDGVDVEIMAGKLLYISYGYVNDNELDEEFNFWEQADNYIYEVESKKLVPACPYFIDVYNEFMSSGEED